jgi:hypothetical protein
MAGSILNMKNHRLLPAISVLTIFLLLTGEFFNCCRINESLANNAKLFIQAMGLLKSKTPIASTTEAQNSHPHCHGHEAQASEHIEHEIFPSTSAFTLSESCLSEFAITKKSMVGSKTFSLDISSTPISINEEPFLVKYFSVNKPRPQNRSSPPIYLLTLRLLV